MFLVVVVMVVAAWFCLLRFRRRRMYQLAREIPGQQELPLFGHLHNFAGDTEPMSLFLVYVIVAVLAYGAWYHWRRMAPLLAAAAKCPGPPALPLIGNATIFLGGTDNILTKMDQLIVKYQTEEIPMRIWLGTKLYFLVSAPAHIERVLNAPETMGKDVNYDFVKVWLGEGLLTSPVTKWKRHRRVIMPSFNQRVLDTFLPVFTEQNREMVRQLQSVADGRTIDCFHYVGRCSLDIVCETAMGVGVGAQLSAESDYMKATQSEMKIIERRMLQIWLRNPLIYRLSGLKRQEHENIRVLHNFSQQIVETKMKNFKQKKEPQGTGGGRMSFLDHIMANTQQEGENDMWSDKELREEVDTMIVAGTDTSASLVSFILMVLGMHQDVQEKVYAELRDIYGSEKRDVTLDDLSRMSYMELVIKEVMRLFPVGPFIVRKVASDLKLNQKLTLPAGSGLFVGIRTVQRDPREWGADADQFRPERFLPGQATGRHPYAYLPFAAGPRNCIGQRYAMMSMKVMLAAILRNFIVDCDSKMDMPLKMEVILRPVHGFNVSLRPRDNSISVI